MHMFVGQEPSLEGITGLRRWQTKPEWLSGISLFRPAKGQI